jgi:hypothetical protein
MSTAVSAATAARDEIAERHASGPGDLERLLLVPERALELASDWVGGEGSGPASEAFRSAGRQLADLIRRTLTEKTDG